MRVVGSAAFIGLCLLLLRALIVGDVAKGYADCVFSVAAMGEKPFASYIEQEAMMRTAKTQCFIAEQKARTAQALLAPSTIER